MYLLIATKKGKEVFRKAKRSYGEAYDDGKVSIMCSQCDYFKITSTGGTELEYERVGYGMPSSIIQYKRGIYEEFRGSCFRFANFVNSFYGCKSSFKMYMDLDKLVFVMDGKSLNSLVPDAEMLLSSVLKAAKEEWGSISSVIVPMSVEEITTGTVVLESSRKVEGHWDLYFIRE